MAPCHHRAVDTLQKTTRNGGDILHFQNFQKKVENRKILTKMLSKIYYLANKNLSYEAIIQNKMKI